MTGQDAWLRVYTPAYGLQVACHHAATLIGLSHLAPMSWGYRHDSVLPASRGRALHEAMADESARVLLSIDSDCWIAPYDLGLVVDVLRELADGGPDAESTAIVGLICQQRDGRPNAWHVGEAPSILGPRLTPYEAGSTTPRRLGAIGYGIVAHNLAWYRSLAASGEIERRPASWYGVIPGVAGPDGYPTWTGEDVFHCQAVRRAGGEIIGLGGGLGRHGTPQPWGPGGDSVGGQ